MIVALAAPRTRLDPGSIALWLARLWCAEDDAMVLVDADPAGTRLAERLGVIAESEYSPAARGLPTLMAARESVTLHKLAEHCYRLDADSGSLWALFAPFHPHGGRLACEWLGRSAEPLAAIDRQRTILVASTLAESAQSLGPLTKSASSAVVIAAVTQAADAAGLRRLCAEAGMSEIRPDRRLLVIEGGCELSDDELGAACEMRVVGRVPVVDDANVLRRRVSRRDRSLPTVLDSVAGLLRADRRVRLPELPPAQMALPEPALPEPTFPEPVLPEPVLPEPVLPEPILSKTPPLQPGLGSVPSPHGGE